VPVLGNFFIYERPAPDHPRTTMTGVEPKPTEIRLDNVAITPDKVPEPVRRRLFEHQFSQPVAVYEDWLRTQTGDLTVPWPTEDLARYGGRLFGSTICLAAWQVLSRAALIGIVDGVRNRLIELALDLEQEAPDAGDLPLSQLPVSGEQVTNIVNTIIYAEATTVNDYSTRVQGTAGNIAGGQGNRIRQGDVSITQPGMDLGALLGALQAAVEQLDGQLPTEQLEAVQGLVEDLEEEATAPQPTRQRMIRTLKGITAIAGAAGGAGAAVVDAVQAIHRALGG
jgi:hypothetical protein